MIGPQEKGPAGSYHPTGPRLASHRDNATGGTPRQIPANGPRKVSVELHDAFQASVRLASAGIDPEEVVETVADEVAGYLEGKRLPRRKAGEVSRVLSILDQLEEETR